jgi:zinc transport system permease protein
VIAEALSQPFFQRALLAALLASIAAGVVGTYVVVKRITSITGGLAHAAFGGVGLGVLLGFDPLLGATGFGLTAGLGVGAAYRRLGATLDTAISIVWSLGMALGMLFIALAPGYAPDLTAYLFGSILFASWDYVWLVAGLDLAILVVTVALFDAFAAISFDEEHATVVGLPVGALWLVLLALVALSVVTLIRLVGVILAIALLTLPAAAARPWARGLGSMMVLATALSVLASLAGLLGSYALSARWGLSVPSGPLIIVVAVVLFGASVGLAAWRRRRGLR